MNDACITSKRSTHFAEWLENLAGHAEVDPDVVAAVRVGLAGQAATPANANVKRALKTTGLHAHYEHAHHLAAAISGDRLHLLELDAVDVDRLHAMFRDASDAFGRRFRRKS